MPDAFDCPEIRYIDAFPFEQDGEKYIYIRDPLEIASAPLVMTPLEFYVITHFDGVHTVAGIQEKFARQFGALLITEERIREIARTLDAHYYLATENYHAHAEQVMEAFHRSPVRKAWHAGSAYEADPEKLRGQIEGFYRSPHSAGMLQELKEVNGTLPDSARKRLLGILTPHIDLRVGAAAYTPAYRQLFEHTEADLFIILGVAHYGGGSFFIATEKDFETPLGIVETDRDFLHTWEDFAGGKLTREDWAHRIEHSIEFQLPFLQHGCSHPFKILPVLCGSVEPHLGEGRRLEDAAGINHQIAALRRALERQGKKAVFVLSVDLAHMGPKFGDDFAITSGKAQEIRQADGRMFDIISRFDIDAFQQIMESDLLPRKVDACSAVYTFLSLMKTGRGEVVSYDQNFQPETQSLVSYGSMVFWGEKPERLIKDKG